MKFRMPFGLEVEEIAWRELTLLEQTSLIRQGYKPAVGEILYGNSDLELDYAHTQPSTLPQGADSS